ncbi:hypothetical protein BpHYR1_016784 [Brachionus plicatilis]|uniref:Uncharacterized protein n=1 Tax=Brachionus plicatilis TaxID=10195 RepID=A0A3M7PNG4_BRAPC|nr:hypothetical protein BpHYR1_016784 [Brachionus plicatilis]
MAPNVAVVYISKWFFKSHKKLPIQQEKIHICFKFLIFFKNVFSFHIAEKGENVAFAQKGTGKGDEHLINYPLDLFTCHKHGSLLRKCTTLKKLTGV